MPSTDLVSPVTWEIDNFINYDQSSKRIEWMPQQFKKGCYPIKFEIGIMRNHSYSGTHPTDILLYLYARNTTQKCCIEYSVSILNENKEKRYTKGNKNY